MTAADGVPVWLVCSLLRCEDGLPAVAEDDDLEQLFLLCCGHFACEVSVGSVEALGEAEAEPKTRQTI